MRSMCAVLCVGVLLIGGGVAAQSLPLSGPGWDLTGATIRVARGDRGDELVVENGVAYRRDVALQDGTIEFDVQLTRRRSFVYVAFRMASDVECEEIYLRAHKSSLPDAIQYAPVRQGQSAWQLYHGVGRTAGVEFKPGTWTHVRLVIKGSQAALFLDDLTTPALRIDHLARTPQAGYFALRGFVPAGTPGTDPAARFANVRVRPDDAPYTFPAPEARPKADGLIVGRWAVSQAVRLDAVTEEVLPAASVVGDLAPVDAGADGLVEFHQWRRLPEGTRAAAAVAQVTVTSSSAQTVAFEMGFSDTALVFLNGRPLFKGEAGYSFDSPRRDGLIGFDQARLYLPLKAGDNTLSIVVTDSFGGWGLMGRFVDATGLTLAAR